MKNNEPQWKRCYRAMLNGEVVSRLWAAKQIPLIAQPGNRCNEMLDRGIPIQKIMVYPEKGNKYMSFFLKQDYIDRVKKALI